MKHYPEYGLRYPGATLTGEGGVDGENGPLFYTRASAGAAMGSNDSQEQILAFYERELTSRGWQLSNVDTAVSTADLDAYAWRKGSVIFRLGFLRKQDLRNPAAGNQYANPFDFTLIADDPRDPSWAKQP